MVTSTAPVPSTAIAIREPAASPMLLEPIFEPAQLVASHAKAARLITEALQSGVDYGVIPGTSGKPSLLKPGAERLRIAFGLSMRFEIITMQAETDRITEYVDKYGKSKTSCGLYRAVVKCILSRDGVDVGEGDGVCSSLENKYISRPHDCENTILKMSEKRAFIAATLYTLGLSNRFTQDVEDHPQDSYESKAAPPKVASPIDKVKALAWTELDRLLVGDGMNAAEMKVARLNCVKRLNDNVAPATLEQWTRVLSLLKTEETPEVIEGDSEPGEEG